MVRFGQLALAAALLATPVLGIDSLSHSVAAETSAPEVRITADVVATDRSGARTEDKVEAAAPACERMVRVVYAGMTGPQDRCRVGR